MTVVLHRHVRELGYCNAGARAWCAQHGIDWAQLLRVGIPIEVVEAAGDAMADAVVDRARMEERQRGQQ